MSTRKAHVVYLDMQNHVYILKSRRGNFSDCLTHVGHVWHVISSSYNSVLATLESIADGDDKGKAIEAAGLLHKTNSFKFLSCLVIFHRLLGITKSLSDQLQSRDLDLHSAGELVISTNDTLILFRNDETWDHTFKYVKDVATLYNVEIEKRRPTRQRRRP